MAGSEIRIWHQSFTVLENLPDYAAALRAHLAKVSRPGTEVVLHGMHPDTYATEYPGADIRFSYLYLLHAHQFAVNGLSAQRQGFDAYANNDLFVNSVAWAAGQEAGVDITTQDPTFRTFKLPSQAAAVSIYIGSICLLPGLVLGAGIYAWVLRRRRG